MLKCSLRATATTICVRSRHWYGNKPYGAANDEDADNASNRNDRERLATTDRRQGFMDVLFRSRQSELDYLTQQL
jgi:hypothetical protein